MTPELLEECEKYRQHFTDLLDIGCKIVNIPDNAAAYISPKDDLKDFCTHCTHGGHKGLNTHLYGCNEAHRWNGKYIYYCPLGLTFISAAISDSNGTISGGLVIGPIVMGDLQDVIYDIPAPEMAWAVSQVSVFSTNKVRHISEILAAVAGRISDTAKQKRDNPRANQEKLLYEIPNSGIIMLHLFRSFFPAARAFSGFCFYH